MAQLIRNAQIVPDNWQPLDSQDALDNALAAQSAASAKLLVPLALWLPHREKLNAIESTLGVLLQGDDDPARIVPDLPRIELIAVHFPRFTDGRGYSAARLLRGRYGFRGELRAVGDVLHDQLYYLMRVGFDAFALRDDQDVQAALRAFVSFSTAYQAASDDPVPLFRRRLAHA